MFELLNNKIRKLIDNKNEELKLLKTEYSLNKRKLIDCRILVDVYLDIEKSKKSIIKYIGGLISTIMASLLLFSSVSLAVILGLLFSIAIKMEFASIKDNKMICNNDSNEKDLSLLLEEIQCLEHKVAVLKDKIELKKKTIERYNGMIKNVEKIVSNQNLLKSDSLKTDRIVSYLLDKPTLVFSTDEEIQNYKSYDDKFIKKELIKSKILENKKKI